MLFQKPLAQLFVALMLVCALSQAAGQRVEPSSLRRERGSLRERVERAASEHFTEGSNRFRPATPGEQQAWRMAVRAVLAGQLAEAGRALAALSSPYELTLFTDTTTGREYVLLEERRPIQAGWGTYIFDLRARSPLVVEVSHPRSDIRTEIEGIDIFLGARAAVFLMAGAHRRSSDADSPCDVRGACANEGYNNSPFKVSDAAHSLVTMFQTTHETVASARPQSVAVSIHGMIEREECPEIFLSSGTPRVTANMRRLARCLERRGVEVGLNTGDCRDCLMTGATNTQGRFSNNPGGDPCRTAATAAPEPGRFIHIEQVPAIRRDREAWRVVVEAFRCAFPAN